MLSPRPPRRRAMDPVVLMLLLATALAGCSGSDRPASPTASGAAVVRVPQDAPTISAAVDLVAAGGLVLVSAGTYDESVTIDKPDVALRGTDRNGTIIDGEGRRPFGVVAIADGVSVENLTVRAHTFYGVLVTGLHDENGPSAHGVDGYTRLDPEKFPPVERFRISHVTASNNGLYGIYAFDAHNGVITQSYASGSADSGFYVGQCRQCNIEVSGNVAERNAIGFENANASDTVAVVGNRFSGNRIGATFISDYQEAFTPQRANLVAGNVFSGNVSSDSPSHAEGGFGIGLGIAGGQDNVIVDNRIDGNPVAGVQVTNTEDLAATGNQISGNHFGDNGVDVADIAAARAPSADNCLADNRLATLLPAALRQTGCPGDYGQGSADPDDLPSVAAPPGVSFLQVTAPPRQPSLSAAEVERAPDKLPAVWTIPSADDQTLPAASYLADRASGG
jgi:nitrous oxidase accessory protein NosD